LCGAREEVAKGSRALVMEREREGGLRGFWWYKQEVEGVLEGR